MIFIVGLIVAFVLIAIFSNRETRQCRWREYRVSGCDLRTRWRCVACGAEVMGEPGQPPRTCQRPGGSRLS